MTMTVTLELKPEEIAVLSDRAQAQGVDIEAVLHGLVAQIAPAPPPPPGSPALTDKQRGLAALLSSWREEDRTDDPEELAARDQDFEEFKANMNRWRAEEGRPPAFE